MSEAEQHQDELLKQERLLDILKRLFDIEHLSSDDILFLASALGLSSEFKKHVMGE